ncbi:MAG: DoxX family protein [Comamonadaceae bacterium]|nr:MAG: DoxX family protein [Comamonadaceae bacterium]
MLNSLQNPLALIGRILLALLFVPAGFSKISGFDGTVGYIASKGVPLPGVAAAIAIVVELGLGLLLLVGFKTRWSALVIALFTLVITFIFHAFWNDPTQQMMFFKNMAIVGGLFGFAAHGGGAWSVDGQRND